MTPFFCPDGEDPILEYRSWSSPSAANVYGKGIDEILMRTDYTASPARTVYYQDDHQGSITHLITVLNGTPTVVETYRYDAFGKPTINDGGLTASAYGNRFMFTGREYVSQFGIYEYRNRAYHPGLGRFMSEDPCSVTAITIRSITPTPMVWPQSPQSWASGRRKCRSCSARWPDFEP